MKKKRSKKAEQAQLPSHMCQAVALRTQGVPYSQIGTQLGVSTVSAYRYVKKALDLVRAEAKEAAEQMTQLELERLDMLQAAHWDAAMQMDKNSSDVILKIMDRRARLLGLDAQRDQINVANFPAVQIVLPDNGRDVD